MADATPQVSATPALELSANPAVQVPGAMAALEVLPGSLVTIGGSATGAAASVDPSTVRVGLSGGDATGAVTGADGDLSGVTGAASGVTGAAGDVTGASSGLSGVTVTVGGPAGVTGTANGAGDINAAASGVSGASTTVSGDPASATISLPALNVSTGTGSLTAGS
jgi:mucin-6/19